MSNLAVTDQSSETHRVATLDRQRPPTTGRPRELHHPPEFDAVAMRRFLALLADPVVGCIEARVLRAAFDRQGFIRRGDDLGGGFGGTTLAGWFDDHKRLIDQARLLRGVSAYVTINPVRRDLLARSDNQLSRARHTTRDEDVLCLRWLYLDIDPLRPPDISSTDQELAAALCRRDAILTDHPRVAASAAWGCSGNGAWILVRLPDYPNDTAHSALVTRSLTVFDRCYSDSVVKIDTATANPAQDHVSGRHAQDQRVQPPRTPVAASEYRWNRYQSGPVLLGLTQLTSRIRRFNPWVALYSRDKSCDLGLLRDVVSPEFLL